MIATGANPRELGIPGEEKLIGKGLHYCAHCDGRFYKNKTVAVVGGGNSAVSDALYLSHLAKKVYLIHRRDSLRATKIYHEPLMKADNVEFVWNSAVSDYIIDGRIVGGCGIIENDFHKRPDLTPNLCALYVEEDCRCGGIAGALLDFASRDMAKRGIPTLYLCTDHTSFYERYGWSFCCMVEEDGGGECRMYVKNAE